MDKAKYQELLISFVTDLKAERETSFKRKINSVYEGNKIRGNNPTFSYIFEDMFTDFLCDLFKRSDYKYLVDMNLTTCLDGNIQYFRPDIIVVERESNVILGVFELKIDDARAEDDWVLKSQLKLARMKDIYQNINQKQSESDNYIRYSTLSLDINGEPIKNKNGKMKTEKHFLYCDIDAKIACLALCEENSRMKKDKKVYRTTGELAMYISKKHFNNANHSLEQLLQSNNLNSEELFNLLEKMQLG
ncbi:hypothetical protein [Paenibacillus oryzisoli]|uniref:Uncharacterized protein n=1 Tax=Paenibacillus oryzisoli TaxID=1850517 RepID=A0A197ZYC6_9BACL|nr:hypothetical protein [Paenibacillus oryzisoli]OAS13733.1 hypothetical protein A8708_25160 [Paenibacillus oryzisoli]